MLLERAAGLSARIASYNQLKGTAEEASLFETRASQFGNVAEKLDRVQSALERFSAAKIPVDFIPSEGATLAERAQSLRSALKVDPNVLADPPFDLKHQFTARLIAIQEAADRAMLQAWQTHVRSSGEAQSEEEILTALAALPQFRQSIARIRQCRAEVAGLGLNLPADPVSAAERLKVLVEQQRAAWAEMTAEGIPGSVIGFLKACAAEGAPLNGLTQEVRTWLETRHLLGAFRIRIR